MTWAKVELTPYLNTVVEEYQEQRDVNKPEAIQAVLEIGADEWQREQEANHD